MRRFQDICERFLGEADPVEINGLIRLCEQAVAQATQAVQHRCSSLSDPEDCAITCTLQQVTTFTSPSGSFTQEREGWQCVACGMVGPVLDALLLNHTCQAHEDKQDDG